jgi:predicted transcriptional regulator
MNVRLERDVIKVFSRFMEDMYGLTPKVQDLEGPILTVEEGRMLNSKEIDTTISEDRKRLLCLEDRTWHQNLALYLRRRFKMPFETYKRKWGLPIEYPGISPLMSQKLSERAKRIGLGLSKGRGRS